MLRIQRRYGKKFSKSESDSDDTPGYTSFEEVIQDVDAVMDVAWVSGTRKSYDEQTAPVSLLSESCSSNSSILDFPCSAVCIFTLPFAYTEHCLT